MCSPRRRCALAFLACSVLAACGHLPSTPDRPPLRYSGRMAVQTAGDADRSFSADFELAGDARAGSLTLLSPLGTQHGHASWSAAGAKLVTSDGIREFATLDALAQELFGQTLPIAALFDWLALRPVPGSPVQPLGTEVGASAFEQFGWQVKAGSAGGDLVVVSRARPEPAIIARIKLDAR